MEHKKRVYPTKENLERIRKMTQLGYSRREIAEELGCTEKSIREWKRRFFLEERTELQKKVADYLNNGVMYFSVRDIKRKVGVRSKELNYLIKKYRELGCL